MLAPLLPILLAAGSAPSAGTQIGQSYCSTIPNSTGENAITRAWGSLDSTLNDVRLETTQLPPGQFGYYLTSQTPASINGPCGPLLCITSDLGRMNRPGQVKQIDASGTFCLDTNQGEWSLDAIPRISQGPYAAMPGITSYFQLWHRDPTFCSQSNFSLPVALTWE